MSHPILFTLLVVSTTGHLEVTESIRTQNQCLEAESMAKYGMTLEGVEEYISKWQRDRAEYVATFEHEHPWRNPSTEWEKQAVSGKALGCVQYMPAGPCLTDVDHGQLRDHLGEWESAQEMLRRIMERKGISATACLPTSKSK